MTWATHAARNSRIPCTVVEVDLDFIEDSLTATNPDGTLCYRTPATTDQGAVTVTTKTRRWMTHTQTPLPELGAVPCVAGVKIADEEIRVGRGLGFFGQATIELVDFVDDDRLEDPFWNDASRSGLDRSEATYFGTLFARNPYWTGRSIRIIEGWTTDGVWHAADTITRNYLIRDVQGPTGGRFTIHAAGPLQLLNLGEIEAPAPSRGTLLADINAVATTATITPSDAADEYPASGLIRAADEAIEFTRSGTTLTLTRAARGTIAESHSAGDTLQLCLDYVDEDLVDIIEDLLVTQAGVDSSLLDLAGWASEQTKWLGLHVLSGVVSEPTKVMDLVQELLETGACFLWWDDEAGLVRLRALRPAAEDDATWSDAYHLLAPIPIQRDLADRVSRADVLLARRTPTNDPAEPASYRIRVLGIEIGNTDTEHGSDRVELIASRWLSSSQVSLAARISFQLASQRQDGRVTYQLEVSAKDASLAIGDIVAIDSRDLIDRRGVRQQVRAVLSKRELVRLGNRYRYLAERFIFDGRFAFMVDTDVPEYADATAEQRDPGAFMSDADGVIGDDDGYIMG